MDKLWKKAALPSIEDFAKEILVKKNLTSELNKVIKIIQEENIGKSVIADSEYTNNLCNVLEAIFIHGLKDKLSNKVSSVFSSASDKIPEPQFWTVVSRYSHKNVISEVQTFTQITNDVGRGRAWLRSSLNDGLILSYVSTMVSDQATLQKFYITTAFFRDIEQSDIMKQLLEGIGVYSFELSCNNSSLNVWNSLPLTLANLWTPPVSPQPVMPAVDVIDFFTDVKHQGKTDSSKVRKVVSQSNEESSVSIGNSYTQNVSEVTNVVMNSEFSSQTIDSKEDKIIEDKDDICAPQQPDNMQFADVETSSKISSSGSVPDFNFVTGDEDLDIPIFGSTGNKINSKSGWSSVFDEGAITPDVDQSYDSLLQSYNKHLSKVVIGTPELADALSRNMGKNEEDYSEYSLDTKSPDLDFEIVPKYFSLEHADEETKKLIDVLGKICPEQGLDTQNFQCYSCGRQIGLIYGKARLCHYDGYNYCYDCHDNEEYYIPARIIHNWDFKQYPVSKRAHVFLTRVSKDSMINLKEMNPEIYTAIEEMSHLQLLRTQLFFLKSYLFTCKNDVADELRKRVWPRDYLHEHVHLYSVDDFLEVPSGVLAQTLQKAITFAKKHVFGCQLCIVKGFICEICENPKPIYSFDVESTYHCEKCLSVYHQNCMDTNKFCPKCVRLLRRKQLLDSAMSD